MHAIFWFSVLLAILWSLGNGWVALMGPCPAFSSNTDCVWTESEEKWFWPHSQLLALGILIFEKIGLDLWARRLKGRTTINAEDFE
jgi:hypothetical protein